MPSKLQQSCNVLHSAIQHSVDALLESGADSPIFLSAHAIPVKELPSVIFEAPSIANFWPPSSSDLSVWTYVKMQVYMNKLHTLAELWVNIESEIRLITPDLLKKV